MRNIKIYKEEEDALFFILSQFVQTHETDECRSIYEKELKLSKRLVKESKIEFAKRGLHDE